MVTIKLFFRNHGVLTELKQVLCSGYGRLPGYEVQDMREGDHRQKLAWCQEVLETLDKVAPGLTLGRGKHIFMKKGAPSQLLHFRSYPVRASLLPSVGE